MEKKLYSTDITNMSRFPRMNLINSLSGFKSANLIGTINTVQRTPNEEGVPNLALFSSAVHIGADPALLGILFRPVVADGKTSRHTYENIKKTGFFTVNHVHKGIYKQAHQTSASYPAHISEFEAVGLTPQYTDILPAPYVAECLVKIGLEYVEEYLIKANNTIMMIGKIIELIVPENSISEDGHLDIGNLETVCVEGLDTYHSTQLLERLRYARP